MKLLKFKINKKNDFIIAKNIELISFINPDIKDKFIKNLNNNLNNINEKTLMKYFENYWIKKRGIKSIIILI